MGGTQHPFKLRDHVLHECYSNKKSVKKLDQWILVLACKYTVLCLIKVKSNTIKLREHTSCYCILDLFCVDSYCCYWHLELSFFENFAIPINACKKLNVSILTCKKYLKCKQWYVCQAPHLYGIQIQ